MIYCPPIHIYTLKECKKRDCLKSLLNVDDADFYFVESKMIANYEKEFYL